MTTGKAFAAGCGVGAVLSAMWLGGLVVMDYHAFREMEKKS